MNKKLYHKSTKKLPPLHQMQLLEMKRKITEEATLFSLIRLLGMSAYVMHNNFGFGKKRLEKLSEELIDHIKMFERGEVTIEDYKNILQEECGINIIDTLSEKVRKNRY